MSAMPTLLLIAWLLPLPPTVTAAGPEPLTDAKRADIQRLLQMTGTAQLGLQFGDALLTQMYKGFQATNPELPPRALDAMKEEINKLMQERMGTLLESIVMIYHENFTHDDIKGLVAFNSTPLGKKVIEKNPAILQQSIAAGQAWSQSMMEVLGQRLERRLKTILK